MRHLLLVSALIATVVASVATWERASVADATGPDTWTLTGPLPQTWNIGSMVALQDGRALLTGQNMQAALYDPGTNAWTNAAPLLAGHFESSATLLNDGRVLVAGGGSGGPAITTAEIYDPLLDQWTIVASMNAGRQSHTATLLNDGRVLVAGGTSAAVALASAEIYDPLANTWVPTGPMSEARTDHDAVRLGDGRVLVANGSDGSAATEVYYPPLGNWSPAEAMATGRIGGSLTTLADGRALAAGGGQALTPNADAAIYDQELDTWTVAAQMPLPATRHGAALLANGLVLVAGGLANGYYSSAWVYNPSTNAWSTVASMQQYRAPGGIARLQNGKVLVAVGSTFSASAELYEAGLIPPPDAATATFTVTSTPANNPPTSTPSPTGTPTNTPTPSPTGITSNDSDNDGLFDINDNCPNTPNPGQENHDRNLIDLSSWDRPADVTLANSDQYDTGYFSLGDACDPDDDNDGLTDAEEADGSLCAGAATDPIVQDSDGDRFLDGAECAMGTSPVNAASKPATSACITPPDADADGVLDGIERCFYNTSDASANTDGDLCSDAREIASVNGDRAVTASDLSLVAQSYGLDTAPGYVPNMDTNKDGSISAIDLSFVARHFGAC